MKEKRSLSRTLLERKTEEQIVSEYGQDGLLTVILKSLFRHDSDRHLRRLEKKEKAKRKKERFKK